MKTLLTAIILAVNTFVLFGSTTIATASGDWGEPGNWSNGSPGCVDTIIIPAGIQIDITSTVDLEGCFPGLDSIIVLVSGTLEFQNGRRLKLPCDSDVYVGAGGTIGVGSGGGNSTYIEICNSQYWNANGGDLTGPSALCDGGCVTLPIELVSFVAKRNIKNRNVDLFWVTFSESNNDYFTVESSTDGLIWKDVVKVDGAGNSSMMLSYTAQDDYPHPGLSYYRLKQTDLNGVFAYSPIVSLDEAHSNQISVYPNPVNSYDDLVVLFPEHYNGVQHISIMNAIGQEVLSIERDLTDFKQIFIQFPSDISIGTYFVFCADQAQKLIIK